MNAETLYIVDIENGSRIPVSRAYALDVLRLSDLDAQLLAKGDLADIEDVIIQQGARLNPLPYVYRPDYWDDHYKFPVHDWQSAVGNGDTRLSYWDWVETQLQAWAEAELARG
jgi:hypothetical protein